MGLNSMRQDILDLIEDYDLENLRIGVLGSHSALEVAYGAKKLDFETVVVCQKGREKTYTNYYRNLFDHVILLDKFSDIVEDEIQGRLKELSTVFVPNRSFSVYVGYENIEEKFKIPIMGNRWMLRIEERDAPKNQYYLLEKAGIHTPKRFRSPEEIDRLAIVKVPEMKRRIERAFFYASTPEEFHRKAEKRISLGIISEKDLEHAVIEEFILGAKFNANFFWSPIVESLDLLGFDRRIQTDLDGLLDLPAEHQLELDVAAQNVEIGHMGATLRESQIEKIFEVGERFVKASIDEYPPGMIGLFALQGAFTRDLEFYVFDVSPRVPGCPCVEPTSPYMKYKYFKEVGPGERIAMELKLAAKRNLLDRIVT
ncbi:MAG: formate--phosphoribosylaminoimidazolecarboxamide ligase family protein [Candidatus Bathyarchaeia archaeon]